MPWSVKSTKIELLTSDQKRKYVATPDEPLIQDLEGLETGLEDMVRMKRLESLMVLSAYEDSKKPAYLPTTWYFLTKFLWAICRWKDLLMSSAHLHSRAYLLERIGSVFQ